MSQVNMLKMMLMSTVQGGRMYWVGVAMPQTKLIKLVIH